MNAFAFLAYVNPALPYFGAFLVAILPLVDRGLMWWKRLIVICTFLVACGLIYGNQKARRKELADSLENAAVLNAKVEVLGETNLYLKQDVEQRVAKEFELSRDIAQGCIHDSKLLAHAIGIHVALERSMVENHSTSDKVNEK
jgi:hypothetical protein